MKSTQQIVLYIKVSQSAFCTHSTKGGDMIKNQQAIALAFLSLVALVTQAELTSSGNNPAAPNDAGSVIYRIFHGPGRGMPLYGYRPEDVDRFAIQVRNTFEPRIST